MLVSPQWMRGLNPEGTIHSAALRACQQYPTDIMINTAINLICFNSHLIVYSFVNMSVLLYGKDKYLWVQDCVD